MISDLLFDQNERDLVNQFCEYTVSELRSNLLNLIQINVIYLYCEALIIENIDCTEAEIAQILDCCKNKTLLNSSLPFHLWQKLKKAKDEVNESDWDRDSIINSILNLIVENTLLRSTLAKFAYK